MIGRRLPVTEGHPVPELAGDYCGPLKGYSGDLPAVFYLLPIARDEGVHPEARSIRHVLIGPGHHQAVEEADGSLTLKGSVLAKTAAGVQLWHGHLTRGVWKAC